MDVSTRMRKQFINQKNNKFMKRFSIFFAALFVAVTSFAAVTYELNGGITNDDNWLNKADMFAAFITESGCPLTVTYDELKAQADPITTIAGKLTADHVTTIMGIEKWDWLETYVAAVQNADPNVGKPSDVVALVEGTADAGWRFALAAFFMESKRASWPVSTDFSTAGQPEAFIPAWKHAFANPTEPTAEWVLNAPYKEDETFLGWYWNADFSGDKVTTINAESNGTLYAKFGTYIPTIAEVRALANDAETKVTGVVNHIDKNNVYIQDATGGILVYTLETPTCQVGDKIVAKGVKTIYNGAPEVKSAVVESSEAATLFDAVKFESLAGLVADSLKLEHFAKRVSLSGLTIVELDSYNNPTVEDALGNRALCYKMSVNPTTFPVGTKINLTAVAAWYNGFQFVGNAAGIEVAPAGVKEAFSYPERHDGRYTLENKWVISMPEDNYTANKPGGTLKVRGMAAKDGIMYFINSETESLVRVDGETGEMLEPLKITGENLFQKYDTTKGVWGNAVTIKFNDIKFDAAGHCLIGACLTNAQTFFIYQVDLETGAATKVLEDVLQENPGLQGVAYRFDAFGVSGDVTKNAVIMAADANSLNVYRWLITDGVPGDGEQIPFAWAETDESLYLTQTSFGTAPQIFPQDEEGELYYVDGFNTLPILFTGNPEDGGMLVDDFINCPTGANAWNNEGDTLVFNAGLNGLIEFQVGEEYFFLMVAGHTVSSAPSSFALFKFADEYRSFSEMEPLWYFPKKGLGGASNGCRTAVPSVEVKDNVAHIYIYSTDNGYAAYTFTVNGDDTAVEDVETVKVEAKKVIDNGNIVVIKNGVKYNMLGAEMK